ncbi:MAG TPA: MFS transporter, partial [Planctomycetaceae bacterium]|nr:MFS transporter [Planctomycetaceae bacterium]
MTVDAPASRHSEFRIWSVCFVLLLASSINYMDRQTLSNVSVRIKTEFGLSGEQYGQIELAFGWAFAIGATVFGVIADRTSIRWLYPAVLLAWSIMGILTGWANSFAS